MGDIGVVRIGGFVTFSDVLVYSHGCRRGRFRLGFWLRYRIFFGFDRVR